jgi:hypothetical protein
MGTIILFIFTPRIGEHREMGVFEDSRDELGKLRTAFRDE